MHYRTSAILSLLALTLLCQSARANTPTDDASPSWPEKMVTVEQLEPLTRYQFRVRGLVTKGKVTGPAVVKAHVEPTGAVSRTVLHASCGNADLDEVALHSIREMRFKPYMADGSAVPVTLVVPIHVPARLGFTK